MFWPRRTAAAMNPKTIGLVVLEHVTAVDVTGPAEAFARTKIRVGNQSSGSQRSPKDESVQSADLDPCYRVLTLGVGQTPCVTECGIEIKPHSSLEEAPPLDTLFVCGCSEARNSRWSRKLSKWLKQRSSFTRRVVGIGTGVYELASLGYSMGDRQFSLAPR